MKIKHASLFLAASLFLVACGDGKKEESKNGSENGEKGKAERKEKADTSGVTQRGAEFDSEGALAASKLPGKMKGKDSLQVKVHGEVTQVCQKKGCWMELDMGEERPKMMVRFKDYEFFVPKDAAGSKATMKGWAYMDTVSVKELRHYAKDKGKSKAAIDSIKEPKVRLAFKASGVVLKEENKGSE